MIDKLTATQEALLKGYRDKVFGYATSTVTDKPKAEAAVLRLTEGVLVGPEIHWACSPEEAEELFCSLQGSPRDSLCDSLRDSLSDSLWNSLWDSLRNSLRNSLWDSLWDSLSDSLRNSLRDSLSDSLRNSLRNSLRDSLSDSLRNSLWDSLRDSLSDSLWNSLWNSLRDSGFVAFYRFSEIGMVKYEEAVSMHLRCYEELNESCFATYALPGHIILLEKPKRVNVEDGKLIEIEW
jgi:hypothetical protein